MSALISLKDVCKSFGGIVVADHISIDIQRGEILGLIGPNGAGKTSLFNLISGVYPADSGSISVSGQSLDGLNLHQRARLGVARTWQHMRLFASMSVLDNMLVAQACHDNRLSLWRDAHSNHARERAEQVLSRFRLLDQRDRWVSELPGGMRKLLDIALAMIGEPRLLLLRPNPVWPSQ